MFVQSRNLSFLLIVINHHTQDQISQGVVIDSNPASRNVFHFYLFFQQLFRFTWIWTTANSLEVETCRSSDHTRILKITYFKSVLRLRYLIPKTKTKTDRKSSFAENNISTVFHSYWQQASFSNIGSNNINLLSNGGLQFRWWLGNFE